MEDRLQPPVEKKAPFKPTVTPRGRFPSRGRVRWRSNSDERPSKFQRKWRSRSVPEGRSPFRRPFGKPGKDRGGFDKSPNQRKPRVNSKPVNRDRFRCFYCQDFGHFIKDCPKKPDNFETGSNGSQFTALNHEFQRVGTPIPEDVHSWPLGFFPQDTSPPEFQSLNL